MRYVLDIDCLGNCCADKLAIKAAGAAGVPHEEVVPVSQMVAYAQVVQRRLGIPAEVTG